MEIKKVVINNQVLNKNEEVWVFDKFIIPNGNEKLEIVFGFGVSAIDDYKKIIEHNQDSKRGFFNALRSWTSEDVKRRRALQRYIKEHHPLVKSQVAGVINKFIANFKVFPDEMTPMTHLGVVFFTGTSIRGVMFGTNNPKKSQVWLNISNIQNPAEVGHILTHEFYHLVSQAREKQNQIHTYLERWHDKLQSSIQSNRDEINQGVSNIFNLIKSEEWDNSRYFSQENLTIILDKCFTFLSGFENRIVDAGLSVTATEVGDIEYLNNMMKIYDETQLRQLTDIFNAINNQKYRFSRQNLSKKFLSTIKILEFLIAFALMPYQCISLGVIPTGQVPKAMQDDARYKELSIRAKTIISGYKKLIKRCEPDVSQMSSEFFNQYLDALKAMSKHYNPKKPELTREVHNPFLMEKAKIAYKTLNRNFKKLMDEYKRSNKG